MHDYKGFTFYFDELICKIAVFSEELNISFSMALTEMQRYTFIKLGGENYPKLCLENAMKRHIDGYIKYIEEQNEHNNS